MSSALINIYEMDRFNVELSFFNSTNIEKHTIEVTLKYQNDLFQKINVRLVHSFVIELNHIFKVINVLVNSSLKFCST